MHNHTRLKIILLISTQQYLKYNKKPASTTKFLWKKMAVGLSQTWMLPGLTTCWAANREKSLGMRLMSNGPTPGKILMHVKFNVQKFKISQIWTMFTSGNPSTHAHNWQEMPFKRRYQMENLNTYNFRQTLPCWKDLSIIAFHIVSTGLAFEIYSKTTQVKKLWASGTNCLNRSQSALIFGAQRVRKRL